MPHAKATAKIHVDISWPLAVPIALAVAKGELRGQIVIRGLDLSPRRVPRCCWCF
jgi:hypothetical protein